MQPQHHPWHPHQCHLHRDAGTIQQASKTTKPILKSAPCILDPLNPEALRKPELGILHPKHEILNPNPLNPKSYTLIPQIRNPKNRQLESPKKLDSTAL